MPFPRRLAAAALMALTGLLVASIASPPSVSLARGKKTSDKRAIIIKKKRKKFYGQTAAQWTRDWWQWMYSLPVAISPSFDDTGAHAGYAQRGPVWFLAGSFDATTVGNREVELPSGRALFFPIVNAQTDNVGANPPLSAKRLRKLAKERVAGAHSLLVELDGLAIPAKYIARVATKEFQYVFTDDNIGQFLGRGTGPGVYAPAAADGFWVMLRPLSPGSHTLRFQGTNGELQLDISYTLTVVDQESFPGKSAR